MANNLGLLMDSYNQARTDSAPPGRTAPVVHLGLTYGDANRGPWYPSERERERVQKLAERDRKKRERRQELRDAPDPWESIRGFLEPETGAGMGALLGTSMLPVAGEAIDIADIAAGIQDRDPWRIGFGGLGLLMPFVAGSTLKKVGDAALFRRGTRTQGTVAADPRAPPGVPSGRMSANTWSEAIVDNPEARRMIDEQIEEGLKHGADEWYELGGIREQMGAGGPGMTFDELNIMGGALSPQHTVPAEISATTLLNFARQNDIPWEETRRIFAQMYPGAPQPGLMGENVRRALRGADQGYLAPGTGRYKDLVTANWKTPAYTGARRGEGVFDVARAGGLAPIDVHAGTGFEHIIRNVPELNELALKGGLYEPGAPNLMTNVLDYQNFSRMFTDAARRFDLPTPSAAQAGQWEGLRHLGITDIQSPPGTFTTILENQIRAANRATGRHPDTVQGALKYWEDVRAGRAMLPQIYPAQMTLGGIGR